MILMFKNEPKWLKMFRNNIKWFKTVHIGLKLSKWIKMVPNSLKCSKIVPKIILNCTKWFKVVQSGLKYLQTVPNDVIWVGFPRTGICPVLYLAFQTVSKKIGFHSYPNASLNATRRLQVITSGPIAETEPDSKVPGVSCTSVVILSFLSSASSMLSALGYLLT